MPLHLNAIRTKPSTSRTRKRVRTSEEKDPTVTDSPNESTGDSQSEEEAVIDRRTRGSTKKSKRTTQTKKSTEQPKTKAKDG